MVHEIFHELKLFNETIVSSKFKGNHSSAVCANWAGVVGNLATTNAVVRVGLIQSFIRHTIQFPVSPARNWYIFLLEGFGINPTLEKIGFITVPLFHQT